MAEKLTYNQKTHNEFIRELQHSYPLIYDEIEFIEQYKTSYMPIIVETKYGLVKTIPNNLLRGKLPTIKSAINKTSFFINKAKEIHGNKYDYSKTIYQTAKKKIIIICKIHGDFLQTPDEHLSGSSCQQCGFISSSNKQLYDTKTFINKANIVHNFKYNYEKTNYKNSKSKVIINCKIHGDFMLNADKHLAGAGCQACALINKKTRALSQEEFIYKANKKHNFKYDYSLSKYITAHIKIKIKCPIHGIFKQTPGSHLHTSGCPKCAGRFEQKYYSNKIPTYDRYSNTLFFIGIKNRRSELDNNILEVQCYKCQKWFQPSLYSVHAKINSACGNGKGYNNLYCSDDCKALCKEYNFNTAKSIDDRSILYTNDNMTSKIRQKNRNFIKNMQCSEYNALYCERCGNEIFDIDKEIHHTLPISKYGEEAINTDTQILLCIKCHLDLHAQCK